MKKTLSLLASAIIPMGAFAQSHNDLDILLMVTLYPLLIVGIFLVCRALFCWYYKINQRVKNQERIIELLESIEKKLGNDEQKPS